MAKSKPKPAPKPSAKSLARAEALSAEGGPLFPAVDPKTLLSTGCTVLNLAVSGTPFGAIPPSTYWHIVGDSGAAKSWFAMCLFAEAARNPLYNKYRFVFDNAENGALMDVAKYFGRGVLDRMCPPRKGRYGSALVQEFYYHVELNVRRGPCIYVLDSMDALQDVGEEDNFEAQLKYYDTGKGKSDIKGSMGMSKAKENSRNINRIANQTLRENGSILVVISQTRDKMNAAYAGQKTHSGGYTLKFYSHVQTWAKIRGDLKKYYKGKDREVGSLIAFDVTKNRVSGWHGKLPHVTFLSDYGVDDVGTNVDYLLEEKHWKKPKAEADDPKTGRRAVADDADEGGGKLFAAPEFDYVGDKDGLVHLVQDGGREAELAALVGHVWTEIRAGAAPARKPRY